LGRIDPDGRLDSNADWLRKRIWGTNAASVYDDGERKEGDEKKEKTNKDLPALEIGGTNWYGITNEANNRVRALANAVDKNAPKILNYLSFGLLLFSPGASAISNYVATAWTIKNDSETGDFTNTAVSTTSLILSSYPSEGVRFGIQAGQILYDNGYFQNSSGVPEYLRPTFEGRNDKKYLELYRLLGNYGF
jgi:hypothetical protein